jgi:hypothetical protein
MGQTSNIQGVEVARSFSRPTHPERYETAKAEEIPKSRFSSSFSPIAEPLIGEKDFMGVLWTVWPLDDDMQKWLTELGVSFPQRTSRFPTGNEIKKALTELDGCAVEVTDNGIGFSWQALITDRRGADNYPWTLLNVSKYSGDEEPQELWFEKGWEDLIVSVLARLPPVCGPLVLIPDTGELPRAIDSRSLPDA